MIHILFFFRMLQLAQACVFIDTPTLWGPVWHMTWSSWEVVSVAASLILSPPWYSNCLPEKLKNLWDSLRSKLTCSQGYCAGSDLLPSPSPFTLWPGLCLSVSCFYRMRFHPHLCCLIILSCGCWLCLFYQKHSTSQRSWFSLMRSPTVIFRNNKSQEDGSVCTCLPVIPELGRQRINESQVQWENLSYKIEWRSNWEKYLACGLHMDVCI